MKSHWKLKGLSLERGWTKSAENLFKKDLSIDTTFSQTNLAGQSLQIEIITTTWKTERRSVTGV